jgi:reactive intermediate/imine deaminase
MDKEAIKREGRMESGLPYSQGIRAGGFVFVSGQAALNPATGEVVGVGDVKAQTRQVIENVRQVLEAGGSSLDQLVKTTVFLADITRFADMNEVYREMIPEPRPARLTAQAPLPLPELLVEIEAIALA